MWQNPGQLAARALLAMQKNKDAIALFHTVIQEAPKDPTPWLLQANAYLGDDQPDAAAVALGAEERREQPGLGVGGNSLARVADG